MISSSELDAGQSLEILLTLTIRGRKYRYATSTQTISNAEDPQIPAALLFVGALAPTEYEDAIAIGGELSPDRSVSVTILFGDDDGDGWRDLVAADHDLGDALGELAIIRIGDDWKARRILLSGRVVSPTYGSPRDPVALTITEEPSEDRGLIPGSLEVVAEDTWPVTLPTDNIPTDAAYNQLYPRVYGAPGVVFSTDPFTDLPAVPALVVGLDSVNAAGIPTNADSDNQALIDPATVLLMGHPGGAAGGTITLYNMAEDLDLGLPKKVTGWNPAQTQDKRGRAVVAVTVNHNASSGAGLRIDGDHPVYWSCESLEDGGVYAERRSTSMRNAAEIIGDLLAHSTIRYDAERIKSLRSQLGAFNLDFFVNEQRSPYSIIQDDILPILPVSPVVGPRGLYFVVWNFTAEAADALDEIDTSRRGGYRNSPVAVSDVSSVFNTLTLDYALRADSGEYARSLTVAPEHRSGDGSTIIHPAAWASATRYTRPGDRLTPRSGDSLASDVVYDLGTALAVLDWQLRANCAVFETVEFVLPQRYAGLDPGAILIVSDSEIGWVDRVCILVSISRGIGDVLVVVRSLPYWVRDAI